MMHYDESKIFVNNEGALYNGFSDNDYFDVLVYHPRAIYKNNRPDWLRNANSNVEVVINDIQITYPCMIKAYHEQENKHAVPVDIIEKKYPDDPIVLLLPKGNYRLLIDNREGDEEKRFIVVE